MKINDSEIETEAKRIHERFQQEPVFDVLYRNNKAIVIDRESGNWEAGPIASIQEIKDHLASQTNKRRSFSINNTGIALECTIYLTNQCNLSCNYCYSDQIRTDSESKMFMSLNMLEKIIPSVLSMDWRAVNFFLYGGEPLLNLDLLTKTIALINRINRYFRKRVYFSTQTNGTLINQENIDIFLKYGFNIGISLDGPPYIHNRNRPEKGGGPSFDKVIRGINLLRQNGISFSITSTIPRPAEVEEIFEFFLNSRLTSSIRLSPMLPEGRGAQVMDEKSIEDFLEKFADAHIRVADRIIENNQLSKFKIVCGNIASMVNNIITDIRPDFCLRSPCGAGYGMIEFHPNGDILTCDKTYYKPELGVLGNISNIDHPEDLQFLYNSSPLRRQIASRTVDNIPSCRKCSFKIFCGAGCTLGSYLKFGSFVREDVLCSYRKKMFYELLWRLADNPYNAILLARPWILNNGVAI